MPGLGAVVRPPVPSPRPEPARGAAEATTAPPVRRAVAVLLSRFPLLTETFILREIEELERQGQPVRLVPLLRERAAVVHREAQPWLPRALFTPYVSTEILAANARMCARRPLRYLLVLARVLFGSLRSWNVLVRTVALLPKCVYLAERLEREGIRHVHAHYATHPATAALIISWFTPISFSFTVHAHDLFVAWRRPLLRAKVRRARFIRVISAFNQTFLRALFPESAEKTRVIHMGIEPDAFPAPQASPREARVLCVAALQPYKGIPVLIEACRQLREAGVRFQCDIVGDGTLRSRLERSIAQARLSDSVHLRGALRQDEVAALLQEAAMVVLPSIVARDGQMEGIPVALMEAMAAERPVIASAISGIPELVDHGLNGLLVEPGNAAALAEAIGALLADPERGREMGRRGRAKVRRAFQLDDVTRALRRELDAWNPPAADAPAVRELIGRAGFGDHDLGVRGVHQGRDSRVVEVMAARGRHRGELILKTHRSRPDASRLAAERARLEYDVLARLDGRFAAAEHRDNGSATALRTPRPLAISMPDASLVMERCDGDRLDLLIRRARASGDGAALEHAVHEAGRWVHRLHDVTRRSDPCGARSAADRLIEAGLRAAASTPARDAICGHLEGLRRCLPSQADLVGCHGDLCPGNIFVSSASVAVVDFEGYHEGLPWEDIAYFLVHLELYFAASRHAAGFGRLREAFLRGAGVTSGDPGLELCRAVAATQALVRVRERAWRAWPQAVLLRRIATGPGRERDRR